MSNPYPGYSNVGRKPWDGNIFRNPRKKHRAPIHKATRNAVKQRDSTLLSIQSPMSRDPGPKLRDDEGGEGHATVVLVPYNLNLCLGSVEKRQLHRIVVSIRDGQLAPALLLSAVAGF